jgi:hypothetical protein
MAVANTVVDGAIIVAVVVVIVAIYADAMISGAVDVAIVVVAVDADSGERDGEGRIVVVLVVGL